MQAFPARDLAQCHVCGIHGQSASTSPALCSQSLAGRPPTDGEEYGVSSGLEQWHLKLLQIPTSRVLSETGVFVSLEQHVGVDWPEPMGSILT